ncbi:UbiA family prenyltransferase [Allosphingosinicella deserti]|nr:UbiA family prenyltransferase [Sphingomonas deserti]
MRDGVAAVLRAGEWWDYKLVPILTFFYATCLLLGSGIGELWGGAVLLLLSLLPGAAYVSIINDITDVHDDLAAGKRNRMVGRSAAFRMIAILLTLAGGAIFFWLWRHERLLLACYGAAWIAFTLYSVPPVRLKARGLAGVLADACGAHLFPTMVAVALACASAQQPVDPVWLSAAAAWALGYGLRGNLWHQLLDRERDIAAGVRTFAERHPPHVAARLGTWLAFPLEVAGLAILLWKMASLLPLLGIAAHLCFCYRRMRLWQMRPVIADPKPGFFIFLHEYYDVLLPLSVLAASAVTHPADLVVLGLHLLLFHRRALVVAEDAWKLVGKSVKMHVERRLIRGR